MNYSRAIILTSWTVEDMIYLSILYGRIYLLMLILRTPVCMRMRLYKLCM